jgi:hypothetical protein
MAPKLQQKMSATMMRARDTRGETGAPPGSPPPPQNQDLLGPAVRMDPHGHGQRYDRTPHGMARPTPLSPTQELQARLKAIEGDMTGYGHNRPLEPGDVERIVTATPGPRRSARGSQHGTREG